MTKDKKVSVEMEFAGKTLSFETGHLAPQATSSILARLGDTVILVTVVMGRIRDDIDYFPMSVEYVEKLYAGGRIKGSRWVKREGRPNDDAILIGRLIDRSVRPLFPKEFKQEVQIVATVLSVDGEHEPDILALNAVSAALAISPIPWKGPIGAIRVGTAKNPEDGAVELILNPTASEGAISDLDVVASQSEELTVMLEAGALQVPEDVMHAAIVAAHTETRKMITFINDLVKKVGQTKKEVTPNPIMAAAVEIVEKKFKKEVEALIEGRANKEGSGSETDELVVKIFDDEKATTPATVLDKKIIGKAVEYVMFKAIRSNVVTKQQRPDGRKLDEVRPINVEVGMLPRTHGSAIFERGLTQALSIVTLGSPRMEQLIESAEGEVSKSYIHHYSGPPYSVGEAGRMGTPSRREIGHGALAERALFAVIPAKDKFPYTIRVVSEVLSQNGSSSMASTCGSTMALMDAGVPILKPVGGISIGMMSNESGYQLLTDIIGLEDFSGDMDFKVAGTDTGITAIQLDVKVPGLTDKQIEEILDRAKVARMFILDKMLASLPESRTNLSTYAPKIETLHIPVEKIGEIIGPGGKIIKNIIAQTGATVDVEDDGTVTVSGTSDDAVRKAYDWVKGIVREVGIGEEFEGPVKRILSFGAFVEFLPGKEGMVHVSQMAPGFVKNPEDIVQIGKVVKVRVMQIDDQGRVNLSMLFGDDIKDKEGGNGGSSDRGEQGPREPREFKPRAPREFTPRENAAPFVSDARPAREPHPLTQQFMRENREKRQGGDRFAGRPRRKTHI